MAASSCFCSLASLVTPRTTCPSDVAAVSCWMRRAPWKTKEAVELATLEWVAWFNHHRLLEPIGYVPPAEAEAYYYRQVASQAAEVAA
jgi:transposase InsO family protein